MAKTKISRVLALFFYLTTIYVFIQPIGILGSDEDCDLKTEYIVKNLTTGKFERCMKVRPCKPGKEPNITRGSVIDIHQTAGPCQKCKEGYTYSARKDREPCQKCNSASCFDHQVVKGLCSIDKDTSQCTDECEEEYVMNWNFTACEAANATDKPLLNNTDNPSPNTTERPPPNSTERPPPNSTERPPPNTTERPPPDTTERPPPNTTDRPPRDNTERHRPFSPDEPTLAGIVISVTIFVFIIISLLLVFCVFKKVETNSKEHEKSGTEPLNRSDTSTDDEPRRAAVNQEQPSTNILMTPLLQQTAVQLQQPMVPVNFQTAQPSVVYIPNANACKPELQFNGLSFEMYRRTCECFDRGLPGKSWTDLAAWLDLNVIEFRAVENLTEGKTNKIIEIWLAKAGNDLDTFLGILKENSMTDFAEWIIESLQANNV